MRRGHAAVLHEMRRAMPAALSLLVASTALAAEEAPFHKGPGNVLSQHCVRCHRGGQAKGALDLSTREGALRGGENGAAIVAGKPDASLLLDYVSGDKPLMPKGGPRLSAGEVAVLRKWIAGGAEWPAEVVLKHDPAAWWSLQPLVRPATPAVFEVDRAQVRTPVDAFVLAKLREHGLRMSPEADRRTLIRRVTFDLTGLPPAPDEVDAFLADTDPRAYEKLVDRLLDSPRYGERWARHWLDVVHYGDTHGYDKDKRRPNAWPYRDYVIRALNADKPYARFVQEQLAGDVLWPRTPDGIPATGFIAAGPWDFVGHVELREGTVDKNITRNLDRDDMVSTAMGTFVSMTVHCARCHDHKFDPIPQADYYGLQAVFAGVDRADRAYDLESTDAVRREELAERKKKLEAQRADVQKRVAAAAGPELESLEKQIDELGARSKAPLRPEFGYHSQISATQDATKWVQVDLGKPIEIASLVFVGCHDDFNNIGAGFGFPVRFRIDVSNDPQMKADVTTVVDRTQADVANPGVRPQSARAAVTGRYVRITATKLAPRQNDFIFAMAELAVLTATGTNAASGASVTAIDSIEAGPRWSAKNLVDGYYYGGGNADVVAEIAALGAKRDEILNKALSAELRAERESLQRELQRVGTELAAAAPRGMVYAAATRFAPAGGFTATFGKPRAIHVLHRGNVKSPGEEAVAGSLSCVTGLPARFDVPDGSDEGARRVALARWITDVRNPLTWRSIVNRVWHYHFGRGIVESPNDFGRMGQLPTHPELLDWLAVEFRDGGQSLKQLHRLMVTSAVYRQSSIADRGLRIADSADEGRKPATIPAASSHPQSEIREPRSPDPQSIDAGNRYLWRMNRRRLDAEEIRDAVLSVSGTLNLHMGGPGFDLFGFQDDHSPHYKYEEQNPDDPRTLRRSVYRFIVRSVPDPFLETLDCADPSLATPVRQATMTSLQALALLNDRFMVKQAEHFAARVEKMGGSDAKKNPASAIDAAFRLALGRSPSADEAATLTDYRRQHGLASACRVILNLNEFVFVD